jgi:hypothetical protein
LYELHTGESIEYLNAPSNKRKINVLVPSPVSGIKAEIKGGKLLHAERIALSSNHQVLTFDPVSPLWALLFLQYNFP